MSLRGFVLLGITLFLCSLDLTCGGPVDHAEPPREPANGFPLNGCKCEGLRERVDASKEAEREMHYPRQMIVAYAACVFVGLIVGGILVAGGIKASKWAIQEQETIKK